MEWRISFCCDEPAEIDLKRARVRAQAATLTAGAAVLAYRAREGQWPATLEAAMKEPPRDPFNGQPLRYHLTDKGFRVESVGKEDRQYTAPVGAGAPIAFGYPAPDAPSLPAR